MRKEVFTDRAQFDARVSQLKLEGRTVISTDSPLLGVIGFSVFWENPERHQGPCNEKDEEEITLHFLVYGRELQKAGNEHCSAEELASSWERHKDHIEFRRYADPAKRTIGFLCHCGASDGVCFVSTVSIVVYKQLQGEVYDALRLGPSQPEFGVGSPASHQNKNV